MKKYIKPKFIIINLNSEADILAASGEGEVGGPGESPDTKRITFLFDDSFDNDLSSVEESDFTTTTNTIQVW